LLTQAIIVIAKDIDANLAMVINFILDKII